MNIKGIASIEDLPIIKLAALIIIFAGAIYAKLIIAPFLLALFISIICMQPITLIAGMMNYIPNIGPIIATIPAFLFALVQLGIGGALWTLGSFFDYPQCPWKLY